MNVQAAVVILTDTKSLSRFRVMKFLFVNVPSSSFLRLPRLSFKGHSCFSWDCLLHQVCKASITLSHKFCACVSINRCRHAHKHTDTHVYRGINREPDGKGLHWHSILLHLDGTIYCVTSGLICSSLQQLRKGVDPMSTKRLTEPRVDTSAFSEEINIIKECQCQCLTTEQDWNTTHDVAVLSFWSACIIKPGTQTGHF